MRKELSVQLNYSCRKHFLNELHLQGIWFCETPSQDSPAPGERSCESGGNVVNEWLPSLGFSEPIQTILLSTKSIEPTPTALEEMWLSHIEYREYLP